MKKIGKDGRVWRLSKESWDFLLPFDSDPNEALKKIEVQLRALQAPDPQVPQVPKQPPHGCNFDEKKLGDLIRSNMEDVLKPFMGG